MKSVEYNVRIRLHPNRAKPPFGQLRQQPCLMRLSRARFREISKRIHAPEERRVQHDRPRHARHHPAQVIASEVSLIRIGMEETAKENAERRPTHAEE